VDTAGAPRDIVKRSYPADDFVSRNDGHMRIGQLAVDDVKVCPAHTAGAHLDADFVGGGKAVWQFRPFQWMLQRLQHHRVHGLLLE
jgi:hypothetical protein